MQVMHAEMYGAQPRCHEDTDMACLLENLEFCTFTDVMGRLQAVVDLEGDVKEDPQGAGTSDAFVRFSIVPSMT